MISTEFDDTDDMHTDILDLEDRLGSAYAAIRSLAGSLVCAAIKYEIDVDIEQEEGEAVFKQALSNNSFDTPLDPETLDSISAAFGLFTQEEM
jgi:hypothetical protein